MGDKTIIAWTDKTWNPWRGCDKVSPGCAHCYMFTEQRRYGKDPETVARTKTWGDPLKWQREAERLNIRYRVFTCSWSDWFHEAADEWRDEAWDVIRRCPNLTFQILTKRSGRILSRLPSDWGDGYPNVWLGVSVENNQFIHRADDLRCVPAHVRFISAEPLLGPLGMLDLLDIDWLIVGGESGPGYRPMEVSWARDLRDKAKRNGTAFFFKQSAALKTEMGITLDGEIIREWPADTPQKDRASV